MPLYKVQGFKGQTRNVEAKTKQEARQKAVKLGLASIGLPKVTKLKNPTIKSKSGWIKAKAVKISGGKLLIKR